jgi:6-phosphogluconolactonase
LRAELVYVTNLYDSTVSAYRIAPNGALNVVQGSPFSAGGGPYSVAVDFLGRFAYVASLNGTVSAYQVDQTSGALTPVAGSPFPAGASASSVRWISRVNLPT